MADNVKRKLPVGAELVPGGVHFRVWAPATATAGIEICGVAHRPPRIEPLQPEPGGYFSGLIQGVNAGTRYRVKLEDGVYPDPASRFQPEGPHGPSEVVDPAFAWTDHTWQGRRPAELVIYELHLGTFTSDGTWRAATAQLPELARLGITLIEIMPIAEFPGRFGWGYDGVNLFAPARIYGGPDEVRAFVDRAHALGVGVILDVVYNHLGPDGNYLGRFSPDYFSGKYENEWGQPLNFDGPNSGPVREFYRTNAAYWIDEFHFDGLRLDATQQILDGSKTHILAEIGTAVQAAGRGRRTFVVAENETQHARLARPVARGGHGLDALWNDDFHHVARVAATGRAEAYYSGYAGRPQEFVSAVKFGYLYQGQLYRWQKNRRGRPAFDLGPLNFVHFIQNHDQVANSLRGLRLHQMADAGTVRALTALLLLSPQIPMLFQGQEFAASAPFLYFADHHPELARKVAEGRRNFLQQFSTVAAPESSAVLTEPSDPDVFQRCKLDLGERESHAHWYQLHLDLLRLRRETPTICEPEWVDGAVLGPAAFVVRLFGRDDADRLLIVNLGVDLNCEPAPEPLLAPLEDKGWRVEWSSEHPAYGGNGTIPLETRANWMIPGHAAVLLAPNHDAQLPSAKLAEKD
jgi:maltooligosyltrehalose trehalohydrolase